MVSQVGENGRSEGKRKKRKEEKTSLSRGPPKPEQNGGKTHRISDDSVRNFTDSRNGLSPLQPLKHLGEPHGVSGRVSIGAGLVGGRFLLDVEISFRGGGLPSWDVAGALLGSRG